MAKRSIVPFGPQHPVLPEPIHLDLVLEDETVVGAVPSIGYVHRGLETLVKKKDFKQYVYIAERVCGICSCHLLWLGLLADALGFESLFMESWRVREKILDMFDETTGGRIIHSVNQVGGVQRDMDSAMLKHLLETIRDIERDLKPLVDTFLKDYTVQSRLKGTGILKKDDAILLGAVGPMLRASGVEYDARVLGYGAYKHLSVEPIISADGDCYGRCEVRLKELFQSFALIREAIGKIPEGDIRVPVKGNPSGEYFLRIEQPRGEAIYYVKGNGTKFLDRFRLRTPTTSNIPPLVETLKGCQLADVPVLILTIDPCISCTER